MGFLRQSAVLAGACLGFAAIAATSVGTNSAVAGAAAWITPLLAIILFLLATRFHEMRTAMAAVALMAGAAALLLFAPGNDALRWIAVLIAIDLAFATTVNEPSIDWEVLGYWCLWLCVSFAVLLGVDHYSPSALSLSSNLLPVDLRGVAIACAFMFALMFCAVRRDPVSSGLAWGLLPSGLMIFDPQRAMLAVAIAIVVLAMALIERSYWIAYFDELTGLKGRRAFSEAMDALHSDYCLAVVDIDHFKSFNDSYGHDVGDQVLRKVAAHLSRVTGGGEPYRCGGEEFVVIFKARAADEAMKHAEKLRQSIEDGVFHVRGPERSQRERNERRQFHKKQSSSRHEAVRVTVSIGVAEAPAGLSPQQVYKAADKALYRAKHGGRNRVELARRAPARAADMIPEQVR